MSTTDTGSEPTGTVDEPPVRTPAELFDLSGCHALVTGASSGLGSRFARVLATAGATVWAAARRKDRLAEAAATDSRIEPVVCDVSSEHQRTAMMETVLEAAGSLDVLVNNAGTGGNGDPLEESSEEFVDVLRTNLVGPFHLAQLAARASTDTRPLSLINVSSIVGMVSTAPLGGAGYAAGKAGLIGLTRQLAGHWGQRVRANALAPGWFHTEMNDALFDDKAAVRWIDRNTMLRRPGHSGELDGALLFLASPASTYCTGQILAVDGGWTAR